eukprot:1354599-Amphidinium_carterae.2
MHGWSIALVSDVARGAKAVMARTYCCCWSYYNSHLTCSGFASLRRLGKQFGILFTIESSMLLRREPGRHHIWEQAARTLNITRHHTARRPKSIFCHAPAVDRHFGFSAEPDACDHVPLDIHTTISTILLHLRPLI